MSKFNNLFKRGKQTPVTALPDSDTTPVLGVNPLFVMNITTKIVIALFILPVVQVFVTLIVPVAQDTSMIAIFSRNLSTSLCFVIVAVFLIKFCDYILLLTADNDDVSYDDDDEDANRSSRIVTVLTCIFVFLKGLLSVYHIIFHISREIVSVTYYYSDAAAWLSLGIFMAFYYRIAFGNQPSSKLWNRFRSVIYAVIVVFIVKFATSITYTIVHFRASGISWFYYLADSVAWLAITIFFILYYRSSLSRQQQTLDVYDMPSRSLGKECEMAARKGDTKKTRQNPFLMSK